MMIIITIIIFASLEKMKDFKNILTIIFE